MLGSDQFKGVKIGHQEMIFLIRQRQRAPFIKVGVLSLSASLSVFRAVYKTDNSLGQPGVIVLKH